MKNLITKDFGWKLFSLFLALAIWLTVHKIDVESDNGEDPVSDSVVTFDNVRVLIVSTASDVQNFRVAPSTVSVTVSGPPDVMENLQVNQIRPLVDLTDITAAKDLGRRVDVSTPIGVTLISVTPSFVGVILPLKR
jgi:YbbR domain-containing protein